MSRDRHSDPLRALSRVAHVLRSSRIDRAALRRALEAARITGISGLAILDGADRSAIAVDPDGFAPSLDDPERWSTSLHRGALEATGPDLRTEPFPTFLEALASLISQAMRTEERVERTRHELRALLASFPAAVAMQRHGLLTYVNPAWTVLTGGGNVGQSAIGWVLDQDRQVAAQALEQVEPEPTVVRLGYDPARWVEIEATSQMAFDGQQVGLVVAREVTGRRAREAERAIRDRIHTTRWITSGISHELNNPLTAIMANIDVAMNRIDELGPGAPWAKELDVELAEAREAADRMRLRIADLRALGREPSQRSEPLDVRRVVDRALSLTHRVLSHRCHVERHYDEVPEVLGQADGLGHVMVALFQNAAESFARQEGPSDRLDPGRPSHRLDIWVRRRGRQVSVEVADDGPGVAPDMVPGLFEPFVGDGNGLGLAMARRIVRDLGGDISYVDRGGPGSLFRISLPVAEPVDVVPALPPRGDRAGRILVVDDEPMIGRAVGRMLGPNYEVKVAATGAEGLDALSRDDTWDLVLLDVMMPGMGGVEVYEEIERQLPHLLPRIVVVTGGIYTEEAHEFLEDRGCVTLQKPFDAEQLVALIDERRSD